MYSEDDEEYAAHIEAEHEQALRDEYERHLFEEHCARAVQYSNDYGIYAVPCKHGSGRYYWRPRTSKGHDPELGWLIENEPTHSGWLTWADAVVALGNKIETDSAT